jgi:predicted outer membrane repeat protein
MNVTDCTFDSNRARYGGAISFYAYNYDWELHATGCTFIGNAADTFGSGGAVSLGAAGELRQCVFSGNHAGEWGGAVMAGSGDVLLHDCDFFDNSADEFGGAVAFQGGLFMQIVDCEFSGNTAPGGAGTFSRNVGVVGFVYAQGQVGDGALIRSTLHPGVPGIGTAVVNGDYSQAPDPGQSGTFGWAGTLAIELMSSKWHDVLDITGDAFLRGTLTVELDDSFVPIPGDRFTFLTASPISAPFDVAFLPGLDNSLFMAVEYTLNTVTIEIQTLESIFGGFDDTNPISVDGIATDVASGDLDGDGDLDVAITVRGATPTDPGFVLVLLNGGFDLETGQWIIDAAIQLTVGAEPSGITIADFDPDAMNGLDIAVSNAGDNDISVLLNDGEAVPMFTRTDFPAGTNPSDIAAADFQEDLIGDIDLVVTNEGDNNVVVLSNDDGAFAITSTLLTGGLGPVAVDPSDIDQDKSAVADLAIVNRDSNAVSIIINNGGGAFSPPPTVAVGDTPVGLVVVDLNDDAFADVATVNRGDQVGGSGTVSVALGAGGGAFDGSAGFAVGDNARSITALDIENDGDPDLAVVADNASGDAVVQVLRNDTTGGQLVFADAAELGAGENPALVTSGDLDGDGRDDLITINENPVGQAGGLQGGGGDTVKARLNATCPWDCQPEPDGIVNIPDFLAMIAQWGQVGTSCDLETGSPGVGINEFLAFVAHFGPCP